MSDTDTVRLLISDTSPVGSGQIFTDADLQSFLTLEGDVKLAAAQALDAIASNETLVQKRITTLDLKTDGPGCAADLRKHADKLRDQAYETGEFDITQTGIGVPELTERVYGTWDY